MRNALMRKAVDPRNQTRTLDFTLPAPIKGWISASNLAEPEPGSAYRLENWFPQRRSLRLRGGALRRATISATLATQSLFSYEDGATAKLFAATDSAIYEVTNPATPTTIPTADITGQTSGRYSTALFSTAGGTFLSVVNGTDLRQLYDGTVWAVAPAITNVSSANLSHVWVYRNRLFFVQKNTLKAWYLPVDSVGGAAAAVSLAGVFQRGGSLLTGTTWSIESGNGLNDRCVFISTGGEVAVFEGSDPSSASTWSLVGRYDIGRMLGKNAFLRVAGDVLLLTADGIIPLSMAISRDRAALSLSNVSQAIEPDWKTEAVARTDNWSVVKWPEKNMTVVGLPSGTGLTKHCWVVNTETGAWADYTGWDTNCMCFYQQSMWFGTTAGTILQAESGGSDDGMTYTSIYVGQFENWGREAVHKVAHLMRSTFRAAIPFTPDISIATNYNGILATPPSAAAAPVSSLWNTALWDIGTWYDPGVKTLTTRWRSIAGQGFSLAPVVQVTSGGVDTPDAELIVSQVKYAAGGIVV